MRIKFLLPAFLLLYKMSIAQTNTFPAQGYVGIGTLAPTHTLQISGGHGDTNLSLFYPHPSSTQQANLTLWASEPGITWTGAGIGNNVSNFVTPSGGITRINTVRGGSYLRLLDSEIRMNVVRTDGVDVNSLAINSNGNIGIGTITPNEKLSVNGNIRAKEIKVEATNWPDYVFEEAYELPSLTDVEKNIKANGHLPGIPSAKTLSSEGIAVSEMLSLQQKKIEELTLYIIEMKKEMDAIKHKIK